VIGLHVWREIKVPLTGQSRARGRVGGTPDALLMMATSPCRPPDGGRGHDLGGAVLSSSASRAGAMRPYSAARVTSSGPHRDEQNLITKIFFSSAISP